MVNLLEGEIQNTVYRCRAEYPKDFDKCQDELLKVIARVCPSSGADGGKQKIAATSKNAKKKARRKERQDKEKDYKKFLEEDKVPS